MEYLKYLFNLNIPKEINALCLSAGAAKGFYQLGACHYIDTKDKFNKINTFIGTSVGAAIACMFAIGYKPLEFFSRSCAEDMNECWEFDISLRQFLIEWGGIDNNKLKEYIQKAIIEKYGFIPTFEQLYLNSGKIFICSAWCLNNSTHKTYFNFMDTPDILISDAVIASCALPGVFTKVQIDKYYYLDGGLFDYCPIEYLITFIQSNFDVKVNNIITLYTKSMGCNEDIQIITLLDYLREIAYIPFFIQNPIDSSKLQEKYKEIPLKYIELNCEHNEITLSTSVQTRIKNFCNGYEQLKELEYLL